VPYTCSNSERFLYTCICQRQGFEQVCDTSNWWRNLFVVFFAKFSWFCIASLLLIVWCLCLCKACGTESIVLRKAAINNFLCQGSCAIYLLKLWTLSLHLYLSKTRFWASMWHKELVEKNICRFLCKIQLTLCCESTGHAMMVWCLCLCKACGTESIVLRKAAINNFLCRGPVPYTCSNSERFLYTCICQRQGFEQDTSNWWRKLFVVFFAIFSWLCVASPLVVLSFSLQNSVEQQSCWLKQMQRTL